jgi:uncharacterized DUF497 family protein
MKYVYSTHIKERMLERDISKKTIEHILTNRVKTKMAPSSYDEGVKIKMGFVNGKGFAIVFNEKTKRLITVRRMRKNEEKYFEN